MPGSKHCQIYGYGSSHQLQPGDCAYELDFGGHFKSLQAVNAKEPGKFRFLFLPAARTVAGLTTAVKCSVMKPLCDLKSQNPFYGRP